MGKQDNDSAENILGNCFILQIIISVILTAILLIWGRDLLLAFGASENTISYATDYMHIYAFGTLFVQLTLGMNAFITAQGFTTFSMVSVLIGAVCNIVLDPVFIFVFHMGVRGAALATVISQAISTLWVVSFLCGQKDTASPQEKASPPGGKGRSSLYRAGTCCFYHAVKRKYCNCLLQFIPASVRR
jgi:Na+-driven multidrug efflux pump